VIIFIRYRYPNFLYGDYEKIVVGDHEKGDYFGQGRLKRKKFLVHVIDHGDLSVPSNETCSICSFASAPDPAA